ncbi:MAG: HlyD family efflux transporter periplasmic adaptor subunit [Planctomycetes bacterium]|nr:HlyD family efflux transporter periplasmic adaptor subunit [Planctomycetota bacterium]
MTTRLDLRQLASQRTAAAGDNGRPPRRPILARYVLPVLVLAGFAGMLLWALRDRLLPAREVTVVPVVVQRAELQQAGTPLFQAAGWVEPRPTPVYVSALAPGIVETLLVVEGQPVEAGQTVARLIDADARLAIRRAQADLDVRRAERDAAHAELDAARIRLAEPVHLEAALADAQATLAETETELARLPSRLRAAQARLDFARQDVDRKRNAGSAVAASLVQQAESALEAAEADVAELENLRPRLEHQRQTQESRQRALQRQLELKAEERRRVADAEAGLKAAEAQVRQAEVALETATLQLERMEVKSPTAGRVLDVLAAPGSFLGPPGLQNERHAGAGGTAVVSLYDPNMLQVRADVRLEDVPLVEPGQPVEIETASAKGPLAGRVLYATSSANVQKNRLEVKVALDSPPPTLRPEMLVRATFLAPPTETDPSDASQEQERLLVPRELVDSSGESSTVWVAEPQGLARRRSVRLGRAGTAELIEVTDGLVPTDKLIAGGREGLTDGDRIAIRENARRLSGG